MDIEKYMAIKDIYLISTDRAHVTYLLLSEVLQTFTAGHHLLPGVGGTGLVAWTGSPIQSAQVTRTMGSLPYMSVVELHVPGLKAKCSELPERRHSD